MSLAHVTKTNCFFHIPLSFFVQNLTITVSSALQDGLITETMGIEMNILVECLVHMVVVDVVEVLTAVVEDTTPIMKGRTLVMVLADGVLHRKMGMMV